MQHAGYLILCVASAARAVQFTIHVPARFGARTAWRRTPCRFVFTSSSLPTEFKKWHAPFVSSL